MSDNLGIPLFNLLWDGLQSLSEENETREQLTVREIKLEEFHNEFGIDASLILADYNLSTGEKKPEPAATLPVMESGLSYTVFDPPNPQSSADSDGPPDATAVTFVAVPIRDSPVPCGSSEGIDNPVQERQEFSNVSLDQVQDFIDNQANKNTTKKTLNDINKFRRFLATKGEHKDVHQIPITLLDEYIASFILSLKKSDGTEYEPTSIRCFISSIDRHLRRHRCEHLIMSSSGPHFSLTRETYNAKKKNLKKQGKGNRPMEAETLTDEDINQMWSMSILGCDSPESLLNTVWLNNCLHFGLRGTTEQYNLRWGDVTLKRTSDGTEFLELKERQTKTRTGENLTDNRKVAPKMFATLNDRCPVEIYKQYELRRPKDFCELDHPFYLSVRTVPVVSGQNGQWFIKKSMGINKLGRLLKSMAGKAGLPEGKRITNHSARKHLVQKLRTKNVPPTEIMAITGHKNIQSIMNYSEISENEQKRCSNILSNTEQTSNSLTNQTANPESAVLPVAQSHYPTHFPVRNLQQLSLSNANNFQSQFYGATFHVQNFNVYN